MSGKKLLSAKDLHEMLKLRYPSPSWALMAQVPDRTGGGNRYADAIAVACWPSLGFQVLGFEIKVNRADWLYEIGHGEKSSEIFRFCDQWWIVAPEEIIENEEMPPTWGLLSPRGKSLRIVKDAPRLTPEPMTKGFMSAILRNALAVVTPEGKLKEQFDQGYLKGLEEGKEIGDRGIKHLKEEIQNLRATIAAFEKGAGVKFPEAMSYFKQDAEAESLGMALRYAVSHGRNKAIMEALRLKEGSQRIIEAVEEALKEAREAAPLPWGNPPKRRTRK